MFILVCVIVDIFEYFRGLISFISYRKSGGDLCIQQCHRQGKSRFLDFVVMTITKIYKNVVRKEAKGLCITHPPDKLQFLDLNG